MGTFFGTLNVIAQAKAKKIIDIMKGRIGEHKRYGHHTNQCNDGNPKEWLEMFECSHG